MVSAEGVCPESMKTLSKEFFVAVYNSVTNDEFFTPLSRSFYEEKFTVYSTQEIKLRLLNAHHLATQN
jgi:hypothetical protein